MASHVKRPRATKLEMEIFKYRLYNIVDEHQPMTVRQVYYRAVVEGAVPKTANGYAKVQRTLVKMRREGDLPFHWLVDNVRLVRSVQTWRGIDEALNATAQFYRRDLWSMADERLELWCESDSVAGVISSVTEEWAVDMYPMRGFSSVSFTHSAAQAANWDGRPVRILFISDHDPAGLELEQAARRDLTDWCDVPIIWDRLGVTWDQVEEYDLPGTPPKKPYGYPMAVETEALPPQLLRELVYDAISEHADPHQLAVLTAAEESEREILTNMARQVEP